MLKRLWERTKVGSMWMMLTNKRSAELTLTAFAMFVAPLTVAALSDGGYSTTPLPAKESLREATDGATAETFGEGISPIDSFKTFLSSPPVVEHLIFSERLPPDPEKPWRYDLSVSESRVYRYYEARWQPGAYFLRDIAATDSAGDPRTLGVLAARFDNHSWFHDSFGYRGRFLQFSAEPDGRLCQTADLNSDVLRQVMTFGLMHSYIGSIRWNGNSFRVLASTLDLEIAGELTPSLSGLPDSLSVTYTGSQGDIHWIIRYAYGAGEDTTGLPSTIRGFWVSDGQELQRTEFVIYALKTRTAKLGLEAFSPARLAATNSWEQHFVSSNAVYALLPSGKLRLIERLGKPVLDKLPGQATPTQLAAVYAVWAAANAFIFILVARMRGKRKHKLEVQNTTNV